MKTERIKCSQRGVALITALLVVALVTVAAAAMATRLQLDLRRTGNILHAEQAYAYVTGAENWARVVLARDAEQNDEDHLGEDWAIRPPVSFVEGGSLFGRIIDLQGRFNVNNLVQGGVRDQAAIDQFKRLLDLLELDTALADYLADWMDGDINPGFPDGAEDDTYLLRKPPYRAANRPLSDISELRLVEGFDRDAYWKLMGEGENDPYVTALPQPTAINVNTASAAVLASLAPGTPAHAPALTLQDGEELVEARADKKNGDEKGFENISEFLDHPLLAGNRQPDPGLVNVASDWFQLVTEANIGQARERLASLVQRTSQGTRVVQRKREFVDLITVADEPTEE